MSTLLLDADGVFVDFVKGFLWAVKEATGKTFTHEQITQFNISKALGLTEEETEATYSKIQPGFCRALEPIPGAIEAIHRLNSFAEIYIVTSPLSKVPTWTHEREAWIKEHLGFHHFHVLHGSAKHLIKGDFLVDDNAENCELWNICNTGTAVIWKQPWNEKFPWYGHRFNNWKHLESLVQGLSGAI